MNSIVYVGMDVHKEQYTLCCYSYETDKVEYKQTIPSDYKLVLKYMEQVRSRYDGEVTFVCGYEAGCLGYSLYHQLKEHAVDCKILAPSTMAVTNTHHSAISIMSWWLGLEYRRFLLKKSPSIFTVKSKPLFNWVGRLRKMP